LEGTKKQRQTKGLYRPEDVHTTTPRFDLLTQAESLMQSRRCHGS
jgi:hypothetical protein